MQAASETSVVAAIDLLLTIGYIDGQLHPEEQALIRRYLDHLIKMTPEAGAYVDLTYARLSSEIAALAAEVTADGDQAYVATRLKVRAVSVFRSFTPADQQVALELMTAVAQADGTIAPHERELHEELLAYFNAPPSLPVAELEKPGAMLRIDPLQQLSLSATSHPSLDALEHDYSPDPALAAPQFASDHQLIYQTISIWEQQRALGNGRLLGVTAIDQLAPGTRWLDGHVHVMRPNQPTELVVLGDLHGCYGCLKAAVLQSSFIEKATAHRDDPANHPDVKLVFLGDYLDRGKYSFEGVLRGALQLQGMFPEHVIMLRGNHEYLVRVGEQIVSAVQPAEAVPAIADRVPPGILDAYRHLFEHMPTSFVFERTLFVHAGVPRDETLAERYRDLSSLDDPVIRFEMMWSDPEQIDTVPLELQRSSTRFSFGRDQFRAFMERIGCYAMVRGHEQVEDGFVTNFDTGRAQLHTLFSAGGEYNDDLPLDSRYRGVVPTALTVRWADGVASAFAWPIDYLPFASAANNGFYR
ncbi:MAG: metallophosphoesterase [Deltaproteobacteria bacterium]|nr:metallophosphoesterase [Deltaproteobacteria bacterium]